MNWTATIIFVLLFGVVTVLGFMASRWRKGDLDRLDEWGLAGRRFGTVVTWFLLGGDLYTAYTFVAVPALVFGAGAIGFFAVPYTMLTFPFVFLTFPRLWSVAHRHGYITGSDFVAGRFGSPTLALAVAVTGILATMPYIALQLVGIEVVIAGLGFHPQGFAHDLPLIIAFAILAAYTYSSGLRAPALIALVKDLLIYLTVIVAIIVIPAHLGGYGAVFDAIPRDKLLLTPPSGGNLGSYSAYATLAVGSALALFLYPHALTGLLSARRRLVVKRNMALLPAYSIALALIAALGYMAYVAGVQDKPAYAGYFTQYGPNFAVPALFLDQFPSWFVGVAFAAVAIGALVPFADGKALASYVGLIPLERSSGRRRRLGKITKQGNPLLRFLWNEAGAHAARRDPELKRFYRRKLAQKGLGKARVAVARKLAIRLYIMLRDGIDYEEFCRRGSHAGMLGDVALV